MTEHLSAEDRLLCREGRCRAIFENGGMGVAVLSAEGIMTEVNPAMRRLCGGLDDGHIGISWSGLVPDAPALAEIALRDAPYTGRHRLFARGGPAGWVDITLTVVRTPVGEVEFFIAMLVDATHAHEAEENRERYERELEQANARKSHFIASASHDIRQPLQAVTILVHLIDDRQLDPNTVQIMNRIRQAVLNLGDMVGSLLDLSKLDAGLIVPELSPVQLGRVFHVIEDEYRSLAQAKDLALIIDVPDDTWVRTDRRLLARILRNLVANAIRYTEAGSVRARARIEDDMAVIEIADTGIGIPASESARIFEEFHQIGNRARTRNEGMGLGLAIVDHLVRLLQLRIALDSEVGVGTVFTLWVPRAEEKMYALPREAEEQLALPVELSALVIDDDIDIRAGLASMLSRQGYDVAEAGGCAEAFDVAKRFPAGPRLIVADYRLPDGTGLEAIHGLRERAGYSIPAVVLTGDTHGTVHPDVRSQGCELVFKPATTRQLQRAIAAALGKGGDHDRGQVLDARATYSAGIPSKSPA